jgi:hypothetical protein
MNAKSSARQHQKGKISDKKPVKKVPAKAAVLKENPLYYYIGLGLVLLLIVFIRINFLEIPFERDEGSYAYSGKIILDGAKTYIDIGSQRLDGVFYAYAAIVALFGYSVKALHIAFIFINLATAVILFFMGRKIANHLTGFAAALFFALLSMTASASGFTVQSEHIVALFAAGAFLSLFYYFDSKKIWQLILSGVLFSLAFQVKQTSFFYGLLAGALIILQWLFTGRENIKRFVLHILIFISAVLIPIAIDLLLIYMNGAWSDFTLWFFDIRNQYTSLITFNDGLKYLEGSFNAIYKNYKFLWIIAFLGTATVFLTNLSLWKKISIAGLNIAGFLTIVPGYHYYGHYFLQWIPALSINGAIFIFSIQHILKNKMQLGIASTVVAFIIILLPVFANLSSLSKYYFNPNHTQILREVYGINPFPESKVIADKLNTLMKEEDKLAVFGTEIQMYVYTNKKSPSRFAGSGALLEFPVAQSEDWQKEFISDVEKAAPKYLVFFSHPISWMMNSKSKNLIFPWFDKFSAANYRLIGYADMFGNTTNYVWEPELDMTKNPPTSQYKIFVFERNKVQ